MKEVITHDANYVRIDSLNKNRRIVVLIANEEKEIEDWGVFYDYYRQQLAEQVVRKFEEIEMLPAFVVVHRPSWSGDRDEFYEFRKVEEEKDLDTSVYFVTYEHNGGAS